MAKQAGRLATLKVGATILAGVRVLNLSWNGTAIDVSDQNSSGFQEFLDGVMGTDALEISVEGLEDGFTLRRAALNPLNTAKFFTGVEFAFPNGDKITGSFVMTAFTAGMPYQEAETFTATFVRNGAHTLTNAPSGGA